MTTGLTGILGKGQIFKINSPINNYISILMDSCDRWNKCNEAPLLIRMHLLLMNNNWALPLPDNHFCLLPCSFPFSLSSLYSPFPSPSPSLSLSPLSLQQRLLYESPTCVPTALRHGIILHVRDDCPLRLRREVTDHRLMVELPVGTALCRGVSTGVTRDGGLSP